FADDPQLRSDPILALVPAERRATLLAQSRGSGNYVWDIHMQGDAETVFFHY
ncbi:protocatechuate 3,4-dioxygenase subunit alpha, partial [Xanthomonas hortorum pv. gardneri]